ncbi:MAG: thioester reductase domain protein, partial [Gammaproteobacteria bacterium]|nr:thioester reductase domain protein [Gammaproteobacteria bacterium]
MKSTPLVIDFVTQRWSSFSSKLAFHYRVKTDWTTMSYETLLAHTKSYGQYLTKLGITPGEKVVFFPENTTDHIIALLGIMFIGAIPCLLDGQLPVEALNTQLRALQPRLAIGSPAIGKKCGVDDIVFLTPNVFLDSAPLTITPSEAPNKDIALILLTSGTSGDYQIVCHSHQGIIEQIKRSVSTLPGDVVSDLKTIFFLPYFHVYPLVNHLLPLLFCGGECLLLNEVNRHSLSEGFRHIKPRIIVVVPRILDMIERGVKEQIRALPLFRRIIAQAYLKLLSLAYARYKSTLRWLNTPFRRRFGGALKIIFCGGAALDKKTHQFIETLIAPVYTGYGLTETAGACVSNTKNDLMSRHQTATHLSTLSVGHVLPGCELRINQTNHQGEGEICIKSNAMMLGYLRDGKIVRPFDQEGWYYTGDLGKINEHGHLSITDRIKDLIVTSDGKKVSPLMLENQYKHIPHISELIVVGLKDKQTDTQKICALVVPTNVFHKEIIEKALFEKAGQLPHQYRLQAVFFVKEIIKTNTMKVNRNKNVAALLNALQSTTLPIATVASLQEKISTDEQEVLIQLVSITSQVLNLPKHQIDVTNNLVQLGMDSIGFADFYLLLLEKYSVNLPLEQIYAIPLTTLANQILNPNICDHNQDDSVLDIECLPIPKLDKDIIDPSHPPLPDQPAQTILLTGATGFLGAFLLRDLMQHTDANIVCLVRAENDQIARARVIENAEKYLTWHEQFSPRLTVFSGDVSQPILGLSKERYEALAQMVDSIIHSAAKVNFLLSFKALYNDNVHAVKELLRFSTVKKLKKMEYISTFSVLLGDRQNQLDENETHIFPTLSLGYTQSKWSAEQLIYQAKSMGLPVNIYRPGIITGDMANGRYNKDDLFMNMVLNCLQIRKYIRLNAPIYMVPVDLVSLSIVKLAARKSIGNIYHLLGGPLISFSSL